MVDIATDRITVPRATRTTRPTLGLVVGKPPERSPVLPAVISRLEQAEVDVRVIVQPRSGTLIPHGLADLDLVAVRGVRSSLLTALVVLRGVGTRFLDAPEDLLAVRDRFDVHERLGRVGLPVPWFRRFGEWSEVRALADDRRIVVKHIAGTVGRGARVWLSGTGPTPVAPPFEGPYLVEEFVRSTRPELKLYRIGDHVAGVLAATGENVDCHPGVTDLSHRVAATLGVSICGIDLLWADDGPRVVDVNAFPSCQRVVNGARLLSDHLLNGLTDALIQTSRARKATA